MLLRSCTGITLPLALAALVACSSKLDGPAAPSGTSLAGHWVSDAIEFKVPGGSPSFVIEFDVDAASRTVSRVTWRLASGGVGNGWNGTATIENSRFKFDQQYEGSCNGTHYRLTLEVVFRSETEADGKWSSEAIAPPGFSYCGKASGDFKPRRRSP